MNRRNFLKNSLAIIPAIGLAGIIQFEQEEEISWARIEKLIDDFNIRYLGRSIKDHPALRNAPSKYTYDFRWIHYGTASEWSITPDELTAKPIKDREKMYAYFISKKQLEAVTTWECVMEHEQKTRKKRGVIPDKFMNQEQGAFYKILFE